MSIQQMFFTGTGGITIPDFISVGNKLPIYGSYGGLYPPPGWSGLVNSSFDDSGTTINLPFTFYIGGSGYTTTYMISNTYITFGGLYTNYSGLSAANPPVRKFMFGAADNSFQRVSTFASGTRYQRIRYEGTASTSGTVGSPNIVLEITLFNPANYNGYNVLELLTGAHSRTGGVSLVANTTTAYATYSQSSLASYVFVGGSDGSAWNIFSNCYVNNTDY